MCPASAFIVGTFHSAAVFEYLLPPCLFPPFHCFRHLWPLLPSLSSCLTVRSLEYTFLTLFASSAALSPAFNEHVGFGVFRIPPDTFSGCSADHPESCVPSPPQVLPLLPNDGPSRLVLFFLLYDRGFFSPISVLFHGVRLLKSPTEMPFRKTGSVPCCGVFFLRLSPRV